MKSEFAYELSKAKFKVQVKSWRPISLMNTYVERLIRFKGKQDWRCRVMYGELYARFAATGDL